MGSRRLTKRLTRAFAKDFPDAETAYDAGRTVSLSFAGAWGVTEISVMHMWGKVHAGPVHVFERYMTAESGRLVLRLPCGTVFRSCLRRAEGAGGDEGGTVVWEVPPASQELLVRGLARIACEYYDGEVAMRRVARAVTGIIPGATVEVDSDAVVLEHEDGWGRRFYLRAHVGDASRTEQGYSSVYAKPAWLLQPFVKSYHDTDEMTVVLPTGEVYDGVELESDTEEGGQWVTCQFDWSNSEPHHETWASMEAYAVGLARIAADHFAGR